MKKDKIQILYEDDFLFAVNKPPRVMSVPASHDPRSRSRPQKSVLELVQEIWAERAGDGRDKASTEKPFLLHRLDMDTSGVLLFGKHEKDREKLESVFKDKRTKKIYVALLKGVPHAGSIRHALPARHSDVKVTAETDFKVLERFPAFGNLCAFVEVVITTGRKHQIRQHFKNIGFPVVMDGRYGDQKFNRRFRLKYRLGRHFLHAARMDFFHPFLEKMVSIEGALAPDLKLTAQRMINTRA